LPFEGCVNVDGKVLLALDHLSIAMLRFGLHATIPEHAASDVDIDVICLEGHGFTSLGSEIASLQAGERLNWPAGIPHRLWTEGTGMLTLMVEHNRTTAAAQALRLEHVGDRLIALLREPDAAQRPRLFPGEGEWSAVQVLGHLAEMIPYWLENCRVLIAADEPPPFGRRLDSEERLAGVALGASARLDELLSQVEKEIQSAAQAIRRMPAAERAKTGLHLRDGEITVAQVVERFIVAHTEEHLAQIQSILTSVAAR
jgi:quercetin dioxygenase-like cupin family protein